MIWNFNGKVTVIEFKYSSEFKEYKCCYNGDFTYAWETGFWDAGPWEWFREGYSLNFAEWMETK